jgi:hypothetical protein
MFGQSGAGGEVAESVFGKGLGVIGELSESYILLGVVLG